MVCVLLCLTDWQQSLRKCQRPISLILLTLLIRRNMFAAIRTRFARSLVRRVLWEKYYFCTCHRSKKFQSSADKSFAFASPPRLALRALC